MKKILILSDSHQNTAIMRKIAMLHADADAVIFLGDGVDDLVEVRDVFHQAILYPVFGNCDRYSLYQNILPEEEMLIEIEAHTILATHGHKYGVKGSLASLKIHGKKQKADILLFGHTHLPYSDYAEGIYLFNPGSAGKRYDGVYHYGLLMLSEKTVLFSHGEVNG